MAQRVFETPTSKPAKAIAFVTPEDQGTGVRARPKIPAYEPEPPTYVENVNLDEATVLKGVMRLEVDKEPIFVLDFDGVISKNSSGLVTFAKKRVSKRTRNRRKSPREIVEDYVEEERELLEIPEQQWTFNVVLRQFLNTYKEKRVLRIYSGNSQEIIEQFMGLVSGNEGLFEELVYGRGPTANVFRGLRNKMRSRADGEMVIVDASRFSIVSSKYNDFLDLINSNKDRFFVYVDDSEFQVKEFLSVCNDVFGEKATFPTPISVLRNGKVVLHQVLVEEEGKLRVLAHVWMTQPDYWLFYTYKLIVANANAVLKNKISIPEYSSSPESKRTPASSASSSSASSSSASSSSTSFSGMSEDPSPNAKGALKFAGSSSEDSFDYDFDSDDSDLPFQ